MAIVTGVILFLGGIYIDEKGNHIIGTVLSSIGGFIIGWNWL